MMFRGMLRRIAAAALHPEQPAALGQVAEVKE
jgi:hypothetical protein